MSTVTPSAAMPPAASDLRGHPAAAAGRVVHRAATEAAPSGSTQVTLGTAPSAVYTDRIGHRPRVSVEAMLAGHAVRASGLTTVANAGAGARQLTYSFTPQVGSPTPLDGDAGAASGEQQQAAIRAVVVLSTMMNVRFVEVALGGQINFGGPVRSPADDSSGSLGAATGAVAAAPAGSAPDMSDGGQPSTAAAALPVVEASSVHPAAQAPIPPSNGAG